MKRLLLIGCLLAAIPLMSQHHPGTPWMQSLNKEASPAARQSNPNYTLPQISAAFEKYWEDKDRFAKGSGYKPFKRWEYFWQHFMDEEGYLPAPKEIWNAWQAKQNSAFAKNPTSNWTSVGPESPGVFPGQLSGTGRINAIAVDPNDENTWYIGAPAGGIWKSTNAGDSWENLFDEFPQIGVSAIAIDPNNSDIIYVGTGDDDAYDSYSIGIFKSLDGGQTWNETGINPETTDIASLISEVIIDPTNSDILWAATSDGLFKTVNGGDTWDRMRNGYIADLELKPNDPNTIYTVTNAYILGGGNNTTYYRSTNGGQDFEEIGTEDLPANNGRVLLAVTPADPELIYVLSTNTGSEAYSYQGFYKSTDGGDSFEVALNRDDIIESRQAWFDLALEVSPTNPDEVYMGCLNIWKTTDGGDNFDKLNEWFIEDEAYSHADIHTIKIFGDKVFACTDGGIYVSEDGGQTFVDKTANAAVGQFYRLSVAPGNSGIMTGGLQDNGGQILGGSAWNNYHGGDGMDNVIDPNNPSLVYGFTQFGGSLNVSADSGESLGRFGPPRDENNRPQQGNWITPLAIAPDGEVYSGFDALYRFTGSGWEKASLGLGEGVDDIEISTTDPQVMYVAQESDLYYTEDAGASFLRVATLPSPIADIAINSNDNLISYVVTSSRVGTAQRFQPADRGVFKITIDGNDGIVEEITNNLPEDQAYFSIVHQGRNSNNPIYVGTSLGVYRLDDTLTEWEDYFTGLPNTTVSDLGISLDDGIIAASTYGRGVWVSPIPVELPQADVRMLAVLPERGTVSCGEVIPELQIENGGQDPIAEVEVSYSLNGVNQTPFTAAIDLASGASGNIALPAIAASEVGEILIEASVTTLGDAFSDNNTAQTQVIVNSNQSANSINPFESANSDLVTFNSSGGESLWERGIPTGEILNQAASGDQVYGTNLDGEYSDATQAFLLTSCYDLSAMRAPTLQFTMAYDLELNFDVLYVQYTLDGGESWSVLGSVNSQPNWYSSDRTNASSGNADDCQLCPGAQWTGTDGELREYAYNFTLNAVNGETDLTGENNVIFRLVFHSDPFVSQEGVIIDNLGVTELIDDDDDDDDGVLDINDNCPLLANADQADNDGDGIGDVCDDDDDNDGVLDFEDNCPFTANADQADTDGDGIGDVCDPDNDNDGVPNADDLCPGTPLGAIVDTEGCEVFSLSPSNFRVRAVGETCISNNNGFIEILAETELNYTATLSDGSGSSDQAFTQSVTFENLVAGSYTVCITVEGQPEYQQCYNLTVTEPDPLSVSSRISSLAPEVELDLQGGNEYFIELNGRSFRTTDSSIRLTLDKPVNELKVSTELGCQGAYTETIVLQAEPLIYPNPVGNEILNIYFGPEAVESELTLYSLNGARVFAKTLKEDKTEVEFDMSGYPSGIYVLNVRTDNGLKIYKIVKR